MQSIKKMPGFRSGLLALTLGPLLLGNALAATDAERIADLEKKLTQSMALIERLSQRVGELEGEKAKPTPVVATPSVAPMNSRVETLEKQIAQMTEASARAPVNSGLPLHGFADVGYASSGKQVADKRKRGFALGNADFYLSPEFGDHVKSLIELNFEYGDAGTLGTDLERLQIGYTFSDGLTLWAGRFHTPYGIWNTAFHHGAQIQTSILRPRMVAFEDQGGILPAHTVGLWATGAVKAGDGRLEYDAYIGNGGRILDGTLDYNAVKDDNGNKVIGGNLRYKWSSGLTLGVHGFTQQIASYNADVFQNRTRVSMLGGFGFYDGNDWEVIGEYYHFNNRDFSGNNGSRASNAGFVQVGHTFRSEWTPYIRLERANLNQRDNYFLSMDSGRAYNRQALGLRLDVNPKAALKFELNHTDEARDGGQKYNEAQLQYAIRF
jgi:hypothetical protein